MGRFLFGIMSWDIGRLRQNNINDFPVNQAVTLHLYGEGIAFNLTADLEAIYTAVAQFWFVTIRALGCLLFEYGCLFLHYLLHLALDHRVYITALND